MMSIDLIAIKIGYISVIISSLTGFCLFIYKIYKKIAAPIKKFIEDDKQYKQDADNFVKETKQFQNNIAEVLKELKPNGGSSLNDSIKQIKEIVKVIQSDVTSITLKMSANYELSQNAMFECDKYGNCISVNKSWTKLTGMTIEEAYGTGWLNTIIESEREDILIEWERALKGNHQFATEYTVRNILTNKNTSVIGRSIIMKNNDDVLGIIGIVEPVKKLKQSID